jgi:hypothetical protein
MRLTRFPTVVPCTALWAIVASCAPPSEAPLDVGDETHAEDGGVDVEAERDIDAEGRDDRAEAPEDEGAPDEPDVEPEEEATPDDAGAEGETRGLLGDPCVHHADCVAGYCVELPTGERVCSGSCTGECPDPYSDWECRALRLGGGSVVMLCLPASDLLCAACFRDDQCEHLGDLCIDYSFGSFCARDCTIEECPVGYACSDVEREGDSYRQCLPESGSCADCEDEDGDGRGAGEDCLGEDCNDDHAAVYEDAPELADGLDNDCDTTTDEGTAFYDDDGDGWCEAPSCTDGSLGGDCNDAAPAIHPEAPEDGGAGTDLANGADDDCDGTTDEGFACVFGRTQACSAGGCAGTQTCAAGCAWGSCVVSAVEACNGVDDDCDTFTDETFDCVPGAGRSCTVLSCAGTQTCAADCTWGSCSVAGSCGSLVINELDYDQPGADYTEFIELYNPTDSAVSCAHLEIWLVNCAAVGGPATYVEDALECSSIASHGYHLIGDAGVLGAVSCAGEQRITGDKIENGSPDAVALVSTATVPIAILDSIVYADEACPGWGEGVPSRRDPDTGDWSLQRVPLGHDTGDNAADFEVRAPTPCRAP